MTFISVQNLHFQKNQVSEHFVRIKHVSNFTKAFANFENISIKISGNKPLLTMSIVLLTTQSKESELNYMTVIVSLCTIEDQVKPIENHCQLVLQNVSRI